MEGREVPCDYYVQYGHLRRPVFEVCTMEQMILLKWRAKETATLWMRFS